MNYQVLIGSTVVLTWGRPDGPQELQGVLERVEVGTWGTISRRPKGVKPTDARTVLWIRTASGRLRGVATQNIRTLDVERA